MVPDNPTWKHLQHDEHKYILLAVTDNPRYVPGTVPGAVNTGRNETYSHSLLSASTSVIKQAAVEMPAAFHDFPYFTFTCEFCFILP